MKPALARLLVVAVVVIAVTDVVVDVDAQVPIPRREVGFVYGAGRADAAVHLDIYIDLICPDSKLALPTVRKVADYYGPDVLRLTTHLFPLPYHRNGFYAAKGTHAVTMLSSGNLTYSWFDTVYNNIDSLTNAATYDISDEGVVQGLVKLATDLGVSGSQFQQLVVSNDMVEMDTRIGWKYSCTRGVAATPTFMVNDVVVAADPSWTQSQWIQVINPLLGKKAEVSVKRLLTDCAPGTKTPPCEYLPGKVECCTPGESCIPNVGCRS